MKKLYTFIVFSLRNWEAQRNGPVVDNELMFTNWLTCLGSYNFRHGDLYPFYPFGRDPKQNFCFSRVPLSSFLLVVMVMEPVHRSPTKCRCERPQKWDAVVAVDATGRWKTTWMAHCNGRLLDSLLASDCLTILLQLIE